MASWVAARASYNTKQIAGVRTVPQDSWATKNNLFLSFLVSEVKNSPS